MNPTQEQIKEFWEWCGLEHLGSFFWDKEGNPIPDNEILDLNNLFKYAVPLFEYVELRGQLYLNSKFACCAMVRTFAGKPHKNTVGGIERIANGKTFEDALFWAIWEIIEGEVINDSSD